MSVRCPRCGSTNVSLRSPSYYAHQGAGYTCNGDCSRRGADAGRFSVSGSDPDARADSDASRAQSRANASTRSLESDLAQANAQLDDDLARIDDEELAREHVPTEEA